MNATTLYVEACKCMLSISDDVLSSRMDLFQLLPKLRQALACRVCLGLLVDPFGSQSCEHYVCCGCLRKKRSLNPGCRWCLNMDNLEPDKQTKVLLACYQKLCEFVAESGVIGYLKSQNGEYNAIVAVIQEAIASPISLDDCLQDQQTNSLEAKANNNNNISNAGKNSSWKAGKMADQSRGCPGKLPAEVIVPLPKRKIVQLLKEIDGIEDQKPRKKKRKHFKGSIYNYNKKKKIKKISENGKDSENLVCHQFMETVQTIENVQDSNEEVQVVDEIDDKPMFVETDLKTQLRGRQCRCGVSTTGSSKKCIGKRCPCYSRDKSCEHCLCCHCANPYNNNNNKSIDELKPILEDEEVCITVS